MRLSLLLLLSLQGYAVKRDTCFQVYLRSYTFESSNYCCDANIHQLLRFYRAMDPTFDPKQAKVLYILRFDKPLEPKNRKFSGVETPWRYHVVLQYHGKILDLDSKIPMPEIAKEYFERMFLQGSGEKRMELGQRIYVREIPAEDYLKEYGTEPGKKDWLYYMNDPDPRYPHRQLDEFLGL